MNTRWAITFHGLTLGMATALCLVSCSPDVLLPVPNATFQTPSGTAAVRDDQTIQIHYSVSVDHKMIGRLELDRDTTPGNGNETRLTADREYDSPGGEDNVDFVAGQFPYGAYYLRVVLADDATSATFSPDGPIYVVPLVENGSDDNAAGLEHLSEVAGMRLLYTNGEAGTVNSRVPFVATWSTVDAKDQLSPVYIAPIELEKPVVVRSIQFFTYSRHAEAQSKNLEFYAGTGADSTGSLITSINLNLPSSESGGWNLVPVDPPITLPAGQYGVSYRGEEECSENWAANAGGGPGYALMSPLKGTPFVPVTQSDLGFSPNFTMRILGSLDKDEDTRLAIGGSGGSNDDSIDRPVEPVDPPTAPSPTHTFPNDGDKPSKTACEEGEDEIGARSPFHVAWRVIR